MNSKSNTVDARLRSGIAWVQQQGVTIDDVAAASADASFRRYFRVHMAKSPHNVSTAILMDAPPSKEDSRPFVQVADLLAQTGAPVPRLYATDLQDGILLLED